jgi:pimeloyl-ACP methyl ester carboxylesterase
VNFTASDGVKLYYEDRGEGEAVVLIHGAAGSGKSFDALAADLEPDFRAIAVDLRGLSRSERVESVSGTAWCDDTVALVDFLGLQRFHLIGCSLGARIASRVAHDCPARVISLSVDAPLLSVAEAASATLNRRFENFDNATPEDLERWTRFHGEDWRTAVAFYGRVRNDPELQAHLTVRPWLPSLTLPTLITRGDIDDMVHPLAHAEEWHRAHPGSWLWVAPDSGFSLTQRRATEFGAVFRRFVAAHASG